ncbi:YveK family protein [Dehalobacterium formicoaceticum]|uniref:Wzz/FepE/Etk N-terminal domain-containing protein n=1 Tax=Dehalobacterium formicoaceticum TaxID=51515 RepID=A0ABT1Y7J9_9FIRM|nr:Wzz/FepE/Etk N-terminal domain-containing protein [Dehalobacterium formicoaceticum]MCR6546860.1 Wzz/FepE/Etk N-terminal domain-containing protein [Dehalobacterium formicoaceticum]
MEVNEYNEEYGEINLLELFEHIIKKWWVVLILTVVAAGVTFYITKEKVTHLYTAQSTIFIGRDATNTLGISMEELSMDNKLIADYRELVNTRLVSERVKKELAITTETDKLSKFIRIDTVNDSRFMRISFMDPDPDLAMKIVNKYSEVLKEKAEDVVGVKNVQIVDQAVLPKTNSSPNILQNTAIAGLLGFMTAIGIIFLSMILSNTFQKEEEIERELGLPSLGVIPKFKGEN